MAYISVKSFLSHHLLYYCMMFVFLNPVDILLNADGYVSKCGLTVGNFVHRLIKSCNS